MLRVIIESPYAGDLIRNELYARRAAVDCLVRGEAPICSHLLFPQFLNDKIPEERKLGIDAGLAWYPAADLILFYEDYGMSPGMMEAYNVCVAANRRYQFRKIGQNP